MTRIKDIQDNNCISQNINNKDINNMKSKNNSNNNKWLILLTIIFVMGFNGGVVLGSSESVYSDIDSKFSNSQVIESSDIVQYAELSKKSIISYSENFIFMPYRQSIDIFRPIISKIIKTSKTSKETTLSNLTTINTRYEGKSSMRYQSDIKKILSTYDKTLMESLFSINFSFFIREILDKSLYDPNKRFQALSFVRNLSDISFIDRSSYSQQLLKKLDEKLVRIFPDSRRLLLNISVEQLFFEMLRIDFNNFNKLDEESTIIKFRIDEGRFVFFKRDKKPFGVNDGFVLVYLEGNSEDENVASVVDRFYIKKYHKGSVYTRHAHRNSQETGDISITTPAFLASSTSRSITSSRSSSSSRFFNLKEPIIYSILEVLNLGPNKEFIINPYVDRGFYIATRDLSLGSKYFSVMSKIEFTDVKRREQTEFCKSIKTLTPGVNQNSISVGLSELDFFATIFLLEDMNTGNYGVVFDNKDDFESKISMASTTIPLDIRSNQFRIIDFAYPVVKQDKRYDEHYTYRNPDDFSKQFIGLDGQDAVYSLKFDHDLSFVGNVLGKEHNRLKFCFHALQQFQSRLDTPVPHVFGTDETGYFLTLNISGEYNFIKRENIDEIDEFMLEQTLIRKNLEIKSLMLQQRGTDDKPEEIMLRHPTEFSESETDFYNYFTDPDSGRLLVHQEYIESNMRQLRIRRPRTHAELIGFKSRGGVSRSVEEPLNLEYIEDAFEDLDNYCQGIMCNYKTLKKFIADCYHEYFE